VGRQVKFTARKPDFPTLYSIQEDHRIRVQILRRKRDATPSPLRRHRYGSFVPCGRNIAEPFVFPTRMHVKRLKILLHVIGNARPAPGNLEVAPILRRHLVIRSSSSRLPTPQPVDANSFPRWRRFTVGLAKVPDGLDAF